MKNFLPTIKMLRSDLSGIGYETIGCCSNSCVITTSVDFDNWSDVMIQQIGPAFVWCLKEESIQISINLIPKLDT